MIASMTSTTSYQGIFLRHSLGDTPQSPSTFSTDSPDIIVAGTSPLSPSDMGAYVTNYSQVSSNVMHCNEANYVYLRGLNSLSTAATARLWLYCVETDLVLWPQKWTYNNIQTGTGAKQNWTLMENVPSGSITLTGYTPQGSPSSMNPGDSFIISPQSPTAGQHYCLVPYVDNSPDITDPNPGQPSFYSIGTITDLSVFLLQNPEVAWKNTVDVSDFGATWETVDNVTGPPDGGKFNIGIRCTNMPTDGFFAFEVPTTSGGGEGISYPKNPITSADMNFLIPVTWPANQQSTIKITYWQGATQPSQGSMLQAISGSDGVSLAEALLERLIFGEEEIRKIISSLPLYNMYESNPFPHGSKDSHLSLPTIGIRPTLTMEVGSISYKWTRP